MYPGIRVGIKSEFSRFSLHKPYKMLFSNTETSFQQFLHCKFRENVVRLLLLLPPHHNLQGQTSLLVCVTKWGSVGLYNPTTMGLINTFCLDLESQHLPPRPKCQKSHLVVDAVVADDIQCVIFATNKGILQCYDTGEIQKENLGLDTLPRGKFLQLSRGQSPLPQRNFGFVETHRIHLNNVPSCLTYYNGGLGTSISTSKLLIGHVDGCVTILEIGKPKYPFAGRRKIRGTLAYIRLQDLTNKLKSYRGHHDPVKEVQFLGGNRNVIISVSRDPKFSLFCKDYTGISESFIISLKKGVNTLTHSEQLNIIVTGSEDGVVRIFSQFSMKMPQMELMGHKAPIMGVNLLPIPFSDSEILLSYSEDVELRVWDPVTFACLQNIHIRFPGGGLSSTIICKTPAFAKLPILICSENQTNSSSSKGTFILLLYCNSFAKLSVDKDNAAARRVWPFDFDHDLDDLNPTPSPSCTSTRLKTNRNPKSISLDHQETSEVENRAISTMTNLMQLKYSKNENRKKSKSLTALATSTLASLHISGGPSKNASIFNKLSLHEIEPIVLPQPPKYYLHP